MYVNTFKYTKYESTDGSREANNAMMHDMFRMKMGNRKKRSDFEGYKLARKNIENLWIQWALENENQTSRSASEVILTEDDDNSDVKVESIRNKLVKLRTN